MSTNINKIKEECARKAKVMLEYNGKTGDKGNIEMSDNSKEWFHVGKPAWDWSRYDYRVIEPKKELVYKPYEKADPKWLGRKAKFGEQLYFYVNGVDIKNANCILLGNNWISLNSLFVNCKWVDYDENGNEVLTPCGELSDE